MSAVESQAANFEGIGESTDSVVIERPDDGIGSSPPRAVSPTAAAPAEEATADTRETASAVTVSADATAPIQRLRTARYSKLSELRPHTVGLNFVLRVQERLPREKLALVGDESGSIYMLVRSGEFRCARDGHYSYCVAVYILRRITARGFQCSKVPGVGLRTSVLKRIFGPRPSSPRLPRDSSPYCSLLLLPPFCHVAALLFHPHASFWVAAENESLFVPGAAIVVRNAFVQHYRDTAAGKVRGGGHSGRGGPRLDRGFVLAIDRVRFFACPSAHCDAAVAERLVLVFVRCQPPASRITACPT